MSGFSALIVAAGRGIRMGARGELRPKGLLKIGGTPLVRRSVSLLCARGVNTVRIVTGHLSDQFEAEFGNDPAVELVHNPDFADTGSLQSLAVGLKGMLGPLLLLEADLIYEASSLDAVSPDQSSILVSGTTGAGDEVYVWARRGNDNSPIFDTMSKDPNAGQGAHFGELTGISCFSHADTESLKRATTETLSEDPRSDYEPAIVRMAEKRDILCHRIADLAWAEIDDEEMYARAKNVVWPEIQRRDGN